MLGRTDGAWARAVVVEVGVGTPPDGTLELLEALRARWPALSLVAVDIAPDYLDALAARAPAGLTVRLGGDRLPLGPDEARLVRAVNLLRRAPLDRVDAALEALAMPLLPGGWLVEGSTDTAGDVGVFRVLTRTQAGLVPRAFVVTTRFERGFDPRLFTAWLPRGTGRHARPGPELRARFGAWDRATQAARAAGHREPPQTFRAAAERLAAEDPTLLPDPVGWATGVLTWDESR